MTLGKVCTLCGLSAFLFGIVFAGAWEIEDYERDHKPRAQAEWAYIAYLRCLEDCREDKLAMCRQLRPDATEEECEIKCPRCDKFKEEGSQ